MIKLLNKFKTLLSFSFIIVYICTITGVFLTFPSVTNALTLQEELSKVKKDLENIRNTKKSLEVTINKEKALQNTYDQKIVDLKNKIDILSNQTEEKKLVIKELELEIEILTNKLNETKEEIKNAENKLVGLEEETNERLVDVYLSQKTFSELNLLVSPQGGSNIIKLNLYQNSIQDKTSKMISQLKDERLALEEKKFALEEDKIKIQRDEVQLKEEIVKLGRDEADLSNVRSSYYSMKQNSIAQVKSSSTKVEVLTEEEKSVLSQITKLERALFNSISAIPNGSPIAKGTIIGRQGCTGFCTGPHTHFVVSYNGGSVNPCNYLPSGVVSGCGTTQSSLRWPQDLPFYITGWYTQRSYGPHLAIDIANPISDAPIYAAHDGYITYGNDNACSKGLNLPYPCNPPGANYAVICENKNNCSAGLKTMYLHLR